MHGERIPLQEKYKKFAKNVGGGGVDFLDQVMYNAKVYTFMPEMPCFRG